MTQTLETPKIGIALIGAGMIGKTHVAALSALRDKTRLMAIVSRHPARTEALCKHYAGPAPLLTSDLRDITQNPEIQVVIVATPPSVRIELIETLAKAGKHILLEKPVARTCDEALQVVEICENDSVTLGVLFQHRMRASSKAAAKFVASGKLGKLGLVEISAPLWRDQSYYDELGRGTYERDGGGVLITQAIHTIDLALSLTGPVTRVQAMTATTPLHHMESEDFAVAGLHFGSGAVGSLIASTASFPPGKEMITLHYEKASLRLEAGTMRISWRDERTENEPPEADIETDNGPILAKHDLHQAVIEDFIECLSSGRDPVVTGREAMISHHLIQAIETSSRTGSPVDIA